MNLRKFEPRLNKLGWDIRRYPTLLLRNRVKLLEYHKISTILDVGANVGQFGLEMRSIGYKANIVSFEPLLSAFKILSSRTEKDSNWTSENIALGDFNGEAQINVSGNSASSSILKINQLHLNASPNTFTIGTELIQVRKLDSIVSKYIPENRKFFLKIDTQGFEKKVIDGATDSIDRILGFQLELSLVEMYRGETLFLDMIEYLKKLGYNLYSLEPGFCDPDSGRLYQTDAFFFKNKK